MNEKQSMRLQMVYFYNGANCCEIKIEEENGLIKVFNDYNELMFSGVTCEFAQFINDLNLNKFA
jgi:hypothetical protein